MVYAKVVGGAGFHITSCSGWQKAEAGTTTIPWQSSFDNTLQLGLAYFVFVIFLQGVLVPGLFSWCLLQGVGGHKLTYELLVLAFNHLACFALCGELELCLDPGISTLPFPPCLAVFGGKRLANNTYEAFLERASRA